MGYLLSALLHLLLNNLHSLLSTWHTSTTSSWSSAFNHGYLHFGLPSSVAKIWPDSPFQTWPTGTLLLIVFTPRAFCLTYNIRLVGWTLWRGYYPPQPVDTRVYAGAKIGMTIIREDRKWKYRDTRFYRRKTLTGKNHRSTQTPKNIPTGEEYNKNLQGNDLEFFLIELTTTNETFSHTLFLLHSLLVTKSTTNNNYTMKTL